MIFVSIVIAFLILGLVILYIFNNPKNDLSGLYMVIIFFLCVFCIILGSEIGIKGTSIKYLQGKPIYKIQQVIENGEIVDTLYVKI